jgi:large subunit ribosomal protein L4
MARAATVSEAPTVDVVDLSGKKLGTTTLPAEWFAGAVNVGVMHQVVTSQLSRARQGTAKTKTRGEARGGGRKPWRQKGTGRARHGSIRSPIWVGGGRAHGRTGEENFVKRVNKSMRRTALRSALTDRAAGEAVTVVRGLEFEEPRTKDAVAALEALGHASKKVLLVLADLHLPTWKSFRNLRSVHLLTVDQLNTYDILTSDVVVFDERALPLIGTGRRVSTADEPPADPAEGEVAADEAGDGESGATAKKAAKKTAKKKAAKKAARSSAKKATKKAKRASSSKAEAPGDEEVQ